MLDGLLVTIAALGTIFGWAFFSFWSAIPAGIALNVAPFIVALTATISYGCGAALVIIVGAPLRERLQRRMTAHPDAEQPPTPNKMVALVQRAWQRFGLVGLALLAPMTVGAQIGAVIGLSFGARPVRLVIALTCGAGLWSLLIALAVVTGLTTVAQL